MAGPPAGTITFLFTDIEGSTRLLQQLGEEEYAGVLTTYQRVLRAAVATGEGYEVDTQGDGFFFAFARATDAVVAAVTAQRALAAHAWPEEVEVRARMGLHTSQPSLDNERYIGLGVHRAARICSAGHGGQVLLSRTTAALVQDDLPEEMLLSDLGEHRLKDLQRPDHIFQVIVPDLPAEFPSLMSEESLSTDLPLPATGLLARRDESFEMRRLLTTLSLELADIIRIIRTKLELDCPLPAFKMHAHEYAGGKFPADAATSLLFEFPTLHEQFPQAYSSPSYKLLFSVNLCRETRFEPRIINELDRFRGRYAIDKIMLWSIASVDYQTVQLLKSQGIDFIRLESDEEQDLGLQPLANYIPVAGRSHDYSVAVNQLAEGLVKRLKKLFHLALSEIAAPIYDEHYAAGRAGTRAVMEFEETRLQRLINRLRDEGRTGVAVEIGCGTGRHSLMLARVFAEVFAYDISPQMIEIANRARRARGDTRVSFCVNDFEYEQLSDEEKYYGRCDLVVASMGMGSFVEDTVRMLRRFHDWLRPGGAAFISFYNEHSLRLKLAPYWRDESLAATLDPKTSTLLVELPGGMRFSVFCKPYDETTKGEINKLFNVDRVESYPTTMALLPNTLLQDEFAYDLFSEIDGVLAESQLSQTRTQLRRQYGHHVVVTAHKQEGSCSGHQRVLQVLEANQPIQYEIVTHGPVLSAEDGRRELGEMVPFENMIKTLIFKLAKTGSFVAAVLPAGRMIDKTRLANRFGVAKSSIKFASEKDVAELGFPLGGVAPFGFPDEPHILKLVDDSIQRIEGDWLYMGTGDNRKTLKLRKQDFLSLVSTYDWVEL